MKKLLAGLGIIGICVAVHAQDLEVKRASENLRTDQVGEKIWLVRMDGENYYLLQKSVVDSLTEKINIKNAIIERHEKVLAIKDTLLAKYAVFEKAANTHIDTLKKLTVVSENLFKGYKSLYADLKRFAGLSTYALTVGIGLADLPGENWKPMFSVGGDYRNWMAQYQFTKDYRGILVGFRWPFIF